MALEQELVGAYNSYNARIYGKGINASFLQPETLSFEYLKYKHSPEKQVIPPIEYKLNKPIDSSCDGPNPYGDPRLKKVCVIRGCSIDKLLEQIEGEEDPRRFKEMVLGVAQLYFDGLVQQDRLKNSKKTWLKQKETLDSVLQAVQISVFGYYGSRESGPSPNPCIPFSDVRELIFSHEKSLIKNSSKSRTKIRHLYNKDFSVKSHARNIASILKDDEIDLVIPIASGGFEPAALISKYLGISDSFPIRFSIVSRADDEVLVPSQAPVDYTHEQINGKRVLIVEDIVCSGSTTSAVINWFRGFEPAQVYFSVALGGPEQLAEGNLRMHSSSRNLYADVLVNGLIANV